MVCIKCGTTLSGREMRTGKEKCVFCLIKGYKFAIGKQMAQTAKVQKELDDANVKIGDLRVIVKALHRKIDRLS